MKQIIEKKRPLIEVENFRRGGLPGRIALLSGLLFQIKGSNIEFETLPP
jgi:hypothetical protein